MNRRSSLVTRPQSAGSRATRTAAAIISTTVLALLATGCGGSPSAGGTSGSPGAEGSARSHSALAYSACVRAHGVPNYPDPDTSGQLPKTDPRLLGVSSSQYQRAQRACQHALPTGGSLQHQEYLCMQNSDCLPAMVQQMLTADRKLAQCMRSHGVPNFPDPITDSHGPVFNITKAGISDAASHTSQFEAKLTECARLVGGNAPESFE